METQDKIQIQRVLENTNLPDQIEADVANLGPVVRQAISVLLDDQLLDIPGNLIDRVIHKKNTKMMALLFKCGDRPQKGEGLCLL